MIQIKLISTTDEPVTAFLVVEPGNIERLKSGRPLKVELEPLLGIKANVVMVYTPDLEFVANYMKERPLNSETLTKALEEAGKRPEMVR